MASTPPLDFSLTRRAPSNPLAEFVNTTPSIVGRLGLKPQLPARLSPGDCAGSVGHYLKPFIQHVMISNMVCFHPAEGFSGPRHKIVCPRALRRLDRAEVNGDLIGEQRTESLPVSRIRAVESAIQRADGRPRRRARRRARVRTRRRDSPG